ncbi:uncharacterized protein LOC110767913 [Prunus avium]|uniref:Uncharacterized protein LOC110746855 n=2 Tax=Prunus avium TaxID=42229 RepID=A0A6P5RLJ4_PRUAV|nr:uncharacterized protein LOC110746855 [Prunus avium]XP_021827270.1 uncharacterized protein LOC110767913 [Prunus avium]
MEIQVAHPVPPVDFNFDSSACSSPYMTAPSSPTRFGNYFFSAPTSPTRASSFYSHFNDFSGENGPRLSASSIPFKWEEKPGIPKSRATINGDHSHHLEEDFEFDFSGQLEKASLPADELFDGGKIRPLKPPPRLQVGSNGADEPGPSGFSPRSPSPRASRLSQGKKLVQGVLSPRHHRKDHQAHDDPFAAAMNETRKNEYEYGNQEERRGRERSPSVRKKGTRSLSPLRVSDVMFDIEEDKTVSSSTINSNKASTSSAYSSFLSAISFSSSKVSRKWKLKDLLLFRSASEGRATTGKDPLRKYTMLSPKKSSSSIAEDVKNSSFRSTDSVGSVSSRRRGPVSPHELHYTANRAVTEEMRRKTFLPYKHGLLGCLGFNPGLHEISRGAFGSLTRGGGCRS